MVKQGGNETENERRITKKDKGKKSKKDQGPEKGESKKIVEYKP